MWRFQVRLQSLVVVAAVGGAGCKPVLPGAYWNVEQSMVEDLCNPTPIPADGSYEYRVIYDVQDITLAIGEDEFAHGTVSGCNLQYQTVVWPEDREEYKIAWQMSGSAVVTKGGGDGCSVEGGGDWAGTEVFTIVTSEDPELSPGCTYTVEMTGTFVEEIDDPKAEKAAEEPT
jgi:hypothetical protein